MGPENSAIRADLLRVAEQITDDEGVSAVTARRLAEALGLKRQIVHYYFRSIDEVIIGVMRAKGARYQDRLERGLAEGDPLHVIWTASGDAGATAAIVEFTALALRRESIRVEITRLLESFRNVLAQALMAELNRRGIEPSRSVHSLVAIIGGVSRSLSVEAAIGVKLGHDHAVSLMEAMIQSYLGSEDLTIQPSAEARALDCADRGKTARPPKAA